MANERAGWKKDGDGWSLVMGSSELWIGPVGDRVHVELFYERDGEMSADQWRALQALPVVPAETPAIADGTSQPWTPSAESGGILAHWLDGRDKPPADTTAVIYGLHARVSALLLERDEARKVGEEALTRATAAETERDALRADRRFELVKAAMASGRDGYTAVRDADEALGAMGGTKGGGA